MLQLMDQWKKEWQCCFWMIKRILLEGNEMLTHKSINLAMSLNITDSWLWHLKMVIFKYYLQVQFTGFVSKIWPAENSLSAYFW